MSSRGRWEESDQLLCLPETKSSPLVRLRGKISVSFRIPREKEIGCRRLGSARKYFHWSLQAQTSLAQSSHTTRIMIVIIIFCPNQHKTLPFFDTQGQASCAQVSRSCQGRGWIWQCGNKRFFLKFNPTPSNKKLRTWKMSFWRLVWMDSVWKWPPTENQRGVAIVEKKDDD